MPTKSLYSMGIASGKASGAYASKKTEASSSWDEMDFTKRRASFEQEKLSRKVETIGAGLELASTVYGGWQDKQKFQTRSDTLADKYGDLQSDTRGFKQKSWDFITGKEKTYTYGEGDSAKTFSRAGVHAQGGMELGESMLDETGFGLGKTETKSESTGESSISENIKRPETLDKAVDSDKSLWQTASGGLTAEANTKLYGQDSSMRGKSKEIRTSRYKELFGDIDFGTNPLGNLE